MLLKHFVTAIIVVSPLKVTILSNKIKFKKNLPC